MWESTHHILLSFTLSSFQHVLCSSQFVSRCTYQSSDRLHICSPCHSLVRTPDDSSNVLTLAQDALKRSFCHTRAHATSQCVFQKVNGAGTRKSRRTHLLACLLGCLLAWLVGCLLACLLAVRRYSLIMPALAAVLGTLLAHLNWLNL